MPRHAAPAQQRPKVTPRTLLAGAAAVAVAVTITAAITLDGDTTAPAPQPAPSSVNELPGIDPSASPVTGPREVPQLPQVDTVTPAWPDLPTDKAAINAAVNSLRPLIAQLQTEVRAWPKDMRAAIAPSLAQQIADIRGWDRALAHWDGDLTTLEPTWKWHAANLQALQIKVAVGKKFLASDRSAATEVHDLLAARTADVPAALSRVPDTVR